MKNGRGTNIFELRNRSQISDIASQKANKAQEAWQTPTLTNGWVEYSASYPVRYRKDDFGIVHMSGIIKSGTGVPLTLPVGYRPAQTTFLAINAGATFGLLYISTDGAMQITAGGNTQISLQDISFSTT